MGKDVVEIRKEMQAHVMGLDSNCVIRTKRAILRALSDLMSERDLNDISVGEIMKRAGVSRSTFYRHFFDKYDVINWSYRHYEDYLPLQVGPFTFDSSLSAQLQLLADHRKFYASALRYTGQGSLRSTIIEANEGYLTRCWHVAHGDGEMPFADLAAIQFTSAGAERILEYWVFDGCKQPVDEVAKAVKSSFPANVLEILL